MTDEERKRLQETIFKSSLKILNLQEENTRLKEESATLKAENEQLKQSYVVKAYDKLRAENQALKKEIERIREEGNNIL